MGWWWRGGGEGPAQLPACLAALPRGHHCIAALKIFSAVGHNFTAGQSAPSQQEGGKV